MTPDNKLSEKNPFIVEEVRLELFLNHLFQPQGGALMLCLEGVATVSINMREYIIGADTEIMLLPDSVMRVEAAGADCRVVFFCFTREFFRSAHYKFDTLFFQYVYESPVFRHTERTAGLVRSLFTLITAAYADTGNRFRAVIIMNYLRNILLFIYDGIQHETLRRSDGDYGRKKEIYHDFIDLIIANCNRHREVAFYAGELCISKSYLASITRGITGETPKATIDEHIVQKIKVLLSFSDMSLQQIADYMHFPDQSYLGRYFKRYTGKSLRAYRSDIGSV